MKKLYRKGTVHPSPSQTEQFSLSFLPAAIFTLTAALSEEDKQVLTYLLSCSSFSTTPFDFDPSKKSHNNTRKSSHQQNQHPVSFTCYCFSCYTSYWARWDSSPNRQLIHEIIDAFEDGLLAHMNKNKKKQGMSRKEKRKNNSKGLNLDVNNGRVGFNGDDSGSGELDRVNTELGRSDSVEKSGEELSDGDDETGEKQGSVRKFVTFIGERIWDSSPNRQIIHEIIDAFEDGLLAHRNKNKKKQGMSRKEKRKNNSKGLNLDVNNGGGGFNGDDSGSGELDRVNTELGRSDSVEKSGEELSYGDDETGEKQGSVRKFVTFIGERIWGSVWG